MQTKQMNRTLIVGKRELTDQEFAKFSKDYLDASTALKDRLNKVKMKTNININKQT